MIWWVYKRVCTVKKLDEVYVATDDERIKSVCEANEIPVVMTANTHRAAAHRLQEVSETIKADFYVQLNGDEPLINTEAVAASIPDRVPQDVEFGTNIITEMTDPAQVMDPSNIRQMQLLLHKLGLTSQHLVQRRLTIFMGIFPAQESLRKEKLSQIMRRILEK